MTQHNTHRTDGQTALITGASTGIGRAFAERFAQQGLDLVIVARTTNALENLAEELRTSTSQRITVLPLDLGMPAAAQELHRSVERLGITVDVLVNNAGFGSHADVARTDSDILLGQVQLNVTALVALTRLFLPGMLERRHGTIINVASNGAYQPLPHMAVYGATKAFVLSFTRALWSETRGTGVRVLTLSPGPTQTAFFDRAGENAGPSSRRNPDQVVSTTLRALRRNRPSVVDGKINALVAKLAAIIPERLSIALAERTLH